MKRLFDFCLAFILLVIFLFPIILVSILITFTSKGPVIFWSERVGRDNKNFMMPKFRTMKIETPQVATHLLGDSENHLTPIGGFLRKSSLDELPQLWSILNGDMSFVGPRPALFNQKDLISLRTQVGVHKLIPGLTGWAQINGRDEISIQQKVRFDEFYLNNNSFLLDIKIIFMTFFKVLLRKDVSH